MTENNTPLITGYPGAGHNGTYPPAPKPKKSSPFKKPIVWLPIVAAVVAFGLGSGSASARTVEVEKVVTKEVPGPERTKTVEKKVTPPECALALGYAEEVLGYSADTIGILSDALGSAGNFDVAALNRVPAKIEAQTGKINEVSPKYRAAKAACTTK